jgi:hypothetical protein
LLLLVFALLPAGGLHFYLQNVFGADAGAMWLSTISGALLYGIIYVGGSCFLQPSIKQLLTKVFSLIYKKIKPSR